MANLRNQITRRSLLLLIIFVGLFGVIFTYSSYIMVLEPWWSQELGARQGESRTVDPPRGSITDRNGNVLAISTRTQSLYANPREIGNSWKLARRLEGTVDLSAAEIYRRIRSDKYFVWLSRKLEDERVDEVKSLDLGGVGFVPEYKRIYPNGSLAAQVLGFVGIDNRGLEGVEKQFDSFLRGKNRSESYQDISLSLTLDLTVQHIVEEELQALRKRTKAKHAMGVVMKPGTGEVLAMANAPSFDPNEYGDYPERRWRNRTISNPVEPGSTLKVMTIGSALAAGDVTSDSSFVCPGYIHFSSADYTLQCYASHGELQIPEILIKSCNVGTVKAVGQMEPTDFYKHLRKFGFGNWTGIGLPGEAEGRLRRPDNWSVITQPSIGIGQGMSVTALQLTSALGSVVNGGVLLQPRIVKSKLLGGDVADTPGVGRIRRVIPEKVSRHMKKYMRSVVTEGTGRAANSELYKLAGKTGTAQKANLEQGGYYEDRVLTSFIGFGPLKESKLVVTVIADEPSRGKYGGEVAAPAFRRIMNRSLKYLERSSGG